MLAKTFGACAVLCLACALPRAALAEIDVGTGATFDFADAGVDFGCGDLAVSGNATMSAAILSGLGSFTLGADGTFDAANARLALGGDFSNAGSFNAGTSLVVLSDACGSGISRLAGATQFYELNVSTTAGKQLVLPAATTQSVSHGLTLHGTAGNLLCVLSTPAGHRAQLAVSPSAGQIIAYVDAKDNQATLATIAPGLPTLYASVDGGDLGNWFAQSTDPGGGSTLRPAPALGGGRWLLIAGLLLLLAKFGMRNAPMDIRRKQLRGQRPSIRLSLFREEA